MKIKISKMQIQAPVLSNVTSILDINLVDVPFSIYIQWKNKLEKYTLCWQTLFDVIRLPV